MKVLYSYGRMKEEIAADRPAVAAAGGAAMCAEVLQFPVKGVVEVGGKQYEISGGRNLEANEAHRIVAMVSLGKKSILFRLGNHPLERVGIVDELGAIIKSTKNKQGNLRFRFDFRVCNCIAATAIDELAKDQCFTCNGAGVERDHDVQALEGPQPMRVCSACMGAKRRRYSEDERVLNLAKEWILAFQESTWHKADRAGREDMIATIANGIRRHRKLHEMMSATDFAKGKLIECERVAAQETGAMLERMLT
jgi:hypothetical protein